MQVAPPYPNPNRNVTGSRLPSESNCLFSGPYATFMSNFVNTGGLVFDYPANKQTKTNYNVDENITCMSELITVDDSTSGASCGSLDNFANVVEWNMSWNVHLHLIIMTTAG